MIPGRLGKNRNDKSVILSPKERSALSNRNNEFNILSAQRQRTTDVGFYVANNSFLKKDENEGQGLNNRVLKTVGSSKSLNSSVSGMSRASKQTRVKKLSTIIKMKTKKFQAPKFYEPIPLDQA